MQISPVQAQIKSENQQHSYECAVIILVWFSCASLFFGGWLISSYIQYKSNSLHLIIGILLCTVIPSVCFYIYINCIPKEVQISIQPTVEINNIVENTGNEDLPIAQIVTM